MDRMIVGKGEIVSGDVPFFTAYRRPLVFVYDKSSPKTMTEMAYVPPQVQIRDMMDAGSRLAAERRARFDTRDLELRDGEDVPLDPMREPGIDLVDLQRVKQGLSRRVAAQRVRAAAKKKEVEDEAQSNRVRKAGTKGRAAGDEAERGSSPHSPESAAVDEP